MTTPPEEGLLEGAAAILGRPLTSKEAARFSKYLDLLSEWNRVHRMVGSSDRRWLIENVVLDGLLFLSVLLPAIGDLREPHGDAGGRHISILDIGSGAGIPGIPIKIAQPDASIVLAESRRKRASFLSAVIRVLELVDTTVFHGRVEALASSGTRFDAVVARCVGQPSRVLALAGSLVTRGGLVIVSAQPDQTVSQGERVELLNPLSRKPRHLIMLRR